jgi:hypothetical protein
MRKILLTAAVVVIGCVAVWAVMSRQESPRHAAGPSAPPASPSDTRRDNPQIVAPPTARAEPGADAGVAAAEPPATPTPSDARPLPVGGRSAPRGRGAAAAAEPDVGGAEPLVPLPDARAALGALGSDPEAEEVWTRAINDPDMPANARKDLIEDLNEEGFDDPKHVTADDLPLILNRIELIERLAPAAADDVNADAFAEAYKDLLNMAAKVTGQ